ncbi:MAG: hypothetical protein ACRC5W_05690 [Cetobacterium sp.]|uniref:hypothetical protein n=1 Tax=Cetobacterium sp. TaxID=2071632 RepID=UPI003F307BA3
MDRQVTIESIKLVEELKKIFPKDGYHLISLQEKLYIWEKDMNISKEKPIEQIDSGTKTKEDFTNNEKNFFDKLSGNIKPETLVKFNLKTKFIERDDNSKTLILGEDFVNNKNQRVLKFTFLNFRDLDLDELRERKLSEEEFISSLVDSFHSKDIEIKVEKPISSHRFFKNEKIIIPIIIVFLIFIIYII